MMFERSPVLSLLSFSIVAIARRRASEACSLVMSEFTAEFTRAVTSSIDIRMLSSRSTHFFSATRSSTSQSGTQARVALADANEARNGSSAQNKQDHQNNCILDDRERH